MQLPPLDKPIGYWLKKADAILTQRIDAVQQQYGMTRLSWQLLHTVCTHPPLTAAILAEFVSPFASVAEVQLMLSTMIDQGWLAWDNQLDSVPTSTPAGQDLHEHCLTQQTLIRQQAMEGISNEQYALTIETLQTLIANLERAPDVIQAPEAPATS